MKQRAAGCALREFRYEISKDEKWCTREAPTLCFIMYLFVHIRLYPPKNMDVTVLNCLAVSVLIH